LKFAIAIEPGTKDTAYGVVVPDLPGCFSAGDTVDEAFDNAREAIEAWCETLAAGGAEIPVPRSLAHWHKHGDFKGWTWGIVEVPIEQKFSVGGPASELATQPPRELSAD
jgi:predicted RNase H-like HicB family nuclease